MDKQLIILIGPQGSGKSWYATKTLRAVTPAPNGAMPKNQDTLVRINQDEQGKNEHHNLFKQAVDANRPVVVDRINHLAIQRMRYVDYAREKGYRIKYVWFDVDWQICARRMTNRKDHPTITAGADFDKILGVYFRGFEPPEVEEYDEIEKVTKREFGRILDLRSAIADSGRKWIIVGDIHGCFDEFVRLLDACGYKDGDFVISVGDLTDRGPHSRLVLEWFRDTPNTFVAEGNHDNKLRRYFMGRNVKMAHGLEGTVKDCEDMDHAKMANWMADWPQIIRLPETDGKPIFVVHAGVDGRWPMDSQKIETCLYARYLDGDSFFDAEGGRLWYGTLDGSYTVVCGHIVHDDPYPAKHVICLDGGAFKGGMLRALVNGRQLVEVKSEVCVENDAADAADDGNLISQLDALTQTGLLRYDDLGDLRVYTYTDQCVHENAWSRLTRMARGIVVDRRTKEVVARPFDKFFNLNEKPETQERRLPWKDGYRVFEKVDGWLGTLYRHLGDYRISTRGSFHSEGAEWATKFLQENHDLAGLPDETTLVFEIVTGLTKIFVEYDDEGLMLLAAFDRHSGDEYPWEQVVEWGERYGFRIPKTYEHDLQDCLRIAGELDGRRGEGFVIRFNDSTRIKIKGEDYCRRARIASNLTPLAVWEAMENGVVDEDYRSKVDDDFRSRMDEIADTLESQYRIVVSQMEGDLRIVVAATGGDDGDAKELCRTERRRKFAENSKAVNHCKMMFSMLDGKLRKFDRYVKEAIRPTNNCFVPELEVASLRGRGLKPEEGGQS